MLHSAGDRLGRSVQATIRDVDWLEKGKGSFHDIVASRPLVEVDFRHGTEAHVGRKESTASMAA